MGNVGVMGEVCPMSIILVLHYEHKIYITINSTARQQVKLTEGKDLLVNLFLPANLYYYSLYRGIYVIPDAILLSRHGTYTEKSGHSK